MNRKSGKEERYKYFLSAKKRRKKKKKKYIYIYIYTSRKPVRCTGKLLKIKSKLILIPFTSFVDFFFFLFKML